MKLRALFAGLLGLLLAAESSLLFTPADAAPRSIRKEFREGAREIARERREMRRDILNSKSKAEARRAYREGMREIGRERREMRREIRREVRRRHVGRVVAGIVLGTVLTVAVAGQVPPRPSPDLCWFWSGGSRTNGYWYHCRDDEY